MGNEEDTDCLENIMRVECQYFLINCSCSDVEGEAVKGVPSLALVS